jgi:GT2 family glycosyltransferase
LIVVENGQPPLALDAFGRLPGDVILEWEPVAGKSRALNRGLEIARGELVVFTDDDVLVDPMWLRELWCAASAHPNEVAFCGPIVPQFPAAVPEWLLRHAYSSVLFASLVIEATEGPLPLHCLPFGPNLAVRANIARKIGFRPDLGPSAENGSLLGEDTAFAAELRDRYGIYTQSRGFWYVPSAPVNHMIGAHKLEFSWMMERFFDLGRSRIVRFGRITHLGRRPKLLEAEYFIDHAAQLTAGAELNFYYGQLHQCRLHSDHARVEYLQDLLERLGGGRRGSLLGPSAVKTSVPDGALIEPRPLPGFIAEKAGRTESFGSQAEASISAPRRLPRVR